MLNALQDLFSKAAYLLLLKAANSYLITIFKAQLLFLGE